MRWKSWMTYSNATRTYTGRSSRLNRSPRFDRRVERAGKDKENAYADHDTNAQVAEHTEKTKLLFLHVSKQENI